MEGKIVMPTFFGNTMQIDWVGQLLKQSLS